jgi:hypothetical protein
MVLQWANRSLEGSVRVFKPGMKATELIKALEEMIAKHGDLRVYSGGGDYPEGVHGVYYRKDGDAYIPNNSFIV